MRKLFLTVSLFFLIASVQISTAQVARVLTLADSLVGRVGGIAIDRTGSIFSADFEDSVWRIHSDGRVSKYATGFYGASGNAFDADGILYQASFYGNYVSRVERNGEHEVWIDEGLNGPVGLTVHPNGTTYVNNCVGNTVSKVDTDKTVSTFSSGALFNCPNGITIGPDGALYVVNFRDGAMIRIDEEGQASLFATIPGNGNGHVAVARGNFYVTAFQTNRIFQVTPDGEVKHVAGTGNFGEQDGAAMEAIFTFPNGIAASPNGDRLVVNDFINRSPASLDVPPIPLANIRVIKLESISDALTSGLTSGGVSEMENAYRAYKSDPSTASIFTEREVNGYGYALMARGNLDAAIRLFELNTESYPNSFNTWDSLAESYMNKGRTADAIKNYEKSLAINPSNQNAVDMIAKIRK